MAGLKNSAKTVYAWKRRPVAVADLVSETIILVERLQSPCAGMIILVLVHIELLLFFIAYRTVDSAGAEVRCDFFHFFLEQFTVQSQPLHRIGHIQRPVLFFAQKHKTEKLQGVDPSLHLIQDKISTVPDIAIIVIDSGNNRNPENDPGGFPGQSGQVCENELISHSGIQVMPVRICTLQVGNKQICNRKDLVDTSFGNTECRFQACVNTFAAAGRKEFFYK